MIHVLVWFDMTYSVAQGMSYCITSHTVAYTCTIHLLSPCDMCIVCTVIYMTPPYDIHCLLLRTVRYDMVLHYIIRRLLCMLRVRACVLSGPIWFDMVWHRMYSTSHAT